MVKEIFAKIRNVFRSIPMPRRVYAEAIRCCICFILGITLTIVYQSFTETKNLSGNDEVNNSTAINRVFETKVQADKSSELSLENKIKEENRVDSSAIKVEEVKTESSVDKITKTTKSNNIKKQADSPQVAKATTVPVKKEEPKISTEVTTEVTQPKAEPIAAVAETPMADSETVVTDYYHGTTYTLDSNIFSSSGLTAAQIDKLIEGKAFHGIGQAVYNIEQTYGVNAYFTLGVSSLESGYGTSAMARNQKNLFGMIGCSYSSWTENIDAFGKLMVKYHKEWGVSNPTIRNINKLYCGTAHWQNTVTSLMNTYVRSANSSF